MNIENQLNNVQPKKNIGDSLDSIWFWWFIMSAIYLAFSGFGYPKELIPTTLGHVAGFFGLFAPYGLTSLLSFMSPPAWISLVVFILLMKYCNKKFSSLNISLGKRILLNLFTLLVITSIIDLIRWTPFESWSIFFNGYMPDYLDFKGVI